MEKEIKADVKRLIEKWKKSFFYDNYDAKDEEVLGILISKYFEYDGVRLLKCFLEALEDSNFHELKSEIENIFILQEVAKNLNIFKIGIERNGKIYWKYVKEEDLNKALKELSLSYKIYAVKRVVDKQELRNVILKGLLSEEK